MMIGDKRKYNVVLITLKAKGANGEVPGTDDLELSNTRSITLAGKSKSSKISEVMDDPVWLACITEAIAATNKIGKFMLLPHNFSEEGGELTPTKKLKRAVAEKKYGKQIEHLYATEGTHGGMYVKWID